jgi:hypothetical protein
MPWPSSRYRLANPVMCPPCTRSSSNCCTIVPHPGSPGRPRERILLVPIGAHRPPQGLSRAGRANMGCRRHREVARFVHQLSTEGDQGAEPMLGQF